MTIYQLFNNLARFEDYGPFATLGMDAPYYSPSEKEYFYNIYGDERGYAYTQNVKILSKIWVMK